MKPHRQKGELPLSDSHHGKANRNNDKVYPSSRRVIGLGGDNSQATHKKYPMMETYGRLLGSRHATNTRDMLGNSWLEV